MSTVGDIALVDGGDRACGELLLVLAARVRSLPPGSSIRLIATDPAAAIDLPAWCHLTGHRLSGVSTDGGRPSYDIVTSHRPRATDSANPWRTKNSSPTTPSIEGHLS